MPDLPEFFSVRTPVARKEHACCECAQAIRPGDEYELAAGKWAGEFSTFKTCARCSRIRIELRALLSSDAVADGYPYFGGLREHSEEDPEGWAEAVANAS